MALRLVVDLEGSTLRLPLAEGDTLIGSDAACAARIRHPSVSRRHAVVRLRSGRAEIEDLDSRNGTRIGHRRISRPTTLSPGSEVRLGSVCAVLEELPDDDLEVALAFADQDPMSPAGEASAKGLTADLSVLLDHFTLGRLPELLERLAQRRDPEGLAAAVGAALLETLPLTAVEVATSGEKSGILFTFHREGEVVSQEVAAASGDLTVRLGSAQASLLPLLEPLARLAAALVSIAHQGSRAAPRRRPPREPPVPEPPTVVEQVRRIYSEAARIARGQVNVLIKGESGTGKEVLARYLHAASESASGPLIALNCAALPNDLLEAELFGIERGVATGVEPRPGKFELAHGGTLFLDEIGDMAPATQAKILRVLQEEEVYRLGGRVPRPAEMRVISATHRDIDAMLADGTFRVDLYHRIADWVVALPALRERRADIPNLAAHFLRQEAARRGLTLRGISRGAIEALTRYDWPGNIRQLQREMARAALFLEDRELLDTSRLQEDIVRAGGEDEPEGLTERLQRIEREEIQKALEECSGNVAAAAGRLHLGLSTLYRRMKFYGLKPPSEEPPGQDGQDDR